MLYAISRRYVINSELINRFKKPAEGNKFLSSLMNIVTIILYPLIIVVGLVSMIVMAIWSFLKFGRLSEEEKKQLEVISEDWKELTSLNELTIEQKFRGEIRFGPAYFELQSQPTIIALEGRTFGDWFYRNKNGIFSQQWNSTDSPNTDLIFVNAGTLEVESVERNIPSVNWNIVEMSSGIVELNCDTGAGILKYQIDLNSR